MCAADGACPARVAPFTRLYLCLVLRAIERQGSSAVRSPPWEGYALIIGAVRARRCESRRYDLVSGGVLAVRLPVGSRAGAALSAAARA